MGNISYNSGNVTLNMTCTATAYYSSRCPDKSPSSGINTSVSSTSNSACRKKREANINAALGASSNTQYTNVVSLGVGGTFIPVTAIYGYAFSNYSRKSSIV
jgi:hypothetical protein